MSNSSENIVNELEALMSVNESERYERFLLIVEKYGYLSKQSLGSVEEFDKIHNHLLNLLLFNHHGGSLVDLTTFDPFQLFMKDLRRLIETLVIPQSIQEKKLNMFNMKIDILEEEMLTLKDETKDLKQLLYEKEFEKLAFAISTPMKNTLLKRFRTKEIRIDPLDEELIESLFTDTGTSIISKEKFANVVNIYQEIADSIGINYKDTIEVIQWRQRRNAVQHDLLQQYFQNCRKSGTKPDFKNLLKHLNLCGLYKFKTTKMQILEKVFDHYMSHDQYR